MEQEKPNKPKVLGGNGSMIVGGVGAVVLLVAVLFFIAPYPKYTSGFETLDDVIADANSKDELAVPENLKDHRRPSWKTHYDKTLPGFFGKKITNLFSWIGLKGTPIWSPSYFKYLLEKRIAEREAKGKSAKYEYSYRITPKDSAQFIVWGDLTGAHHSLVRGLEKLVKLGVMDTNLKLTSPDDYILFMGDAAARSPFTMELLTLIMKLEERNSDRIIYITGNNERRGAWYTYGLKEEIQRKAPHLTSEAAPLFKVVEQYFETLPLATYISIPPHDTNEFVRLSHFSMETPSKESYRNFVEILDDTYYSQELLADRKVGVNEIIKLDANRNVPDPELVNVRATIKSYRKTREYQKNDGLRLLVPDKNATAWTVLSSPSVFVHKILDFWQDAFVIVQSTPVIENWTITLYTRDMRTKDDFRTETYNLLSGKNILEGGREAVFEAAAKKKPKKTPVAPKVEKTAEPNAKPVAPTSQIRR